MCFVAYMTGRFTLYLARYNEKGFVFDRHVPILDDYIFRICTQKLCRAVGLMTITDKGIELHISSFIGFYEDNGSGNLNETFFKIVCLYLGGFF